MNNSVNNYYRMTEIDFFIAIHGVLDHAFSDGYSLEWLEERIGSAFQQFIIKNYESQSDTPDKA